MIKYLLLKNFYSLINRLSDGKKKEKTKAEGCLSLVSPRSGLRTGILTIQIEFDIIMC